MVPLRILFLEYKERPMTKNLWLPAIGVGLVAAAALTSMSCGATPSPRLTLRTSVASTASKTPAVPAGTAGTAGATCALADGLALCGDLVIDRVRVLVAKTELEKDSHSTGTSGPTGATGTSGPTGPTGAWQDDEACEHDSACDGEDEVKIGPFVADLCGAALSAPSVEILDLPVPAGTYESIKFAVRALRHPADLSPALQAMQDAGASIIVEGRWKGASFTFKSAMRVAQENEGSFTFGTGPNIATLIVNPAAWFVGANGAVLDPTDDANRGAILGNIRCSMKIHSGEEDDDREEAASCGATPTSLASSRDESRATCQSESAGHEAEHCHHCCVAATLACPPGPAP
jgi:hypothetical protein